MAEQTGAIRDFKVETLEDMPPPQNPIAAAIPSIAGESVAQRSRLEEEVIDLFDRFRDRMLRYLLAFGLSISDSEEIVQEVFLSLFRHLESGKPRDNLAGWLFRVAHNLALKRRDQMRRSLEVLSPGINRDYAVAPGPTPEDQLVHHQTQERLREVVSALPEQDGRCLALRAEGLRYREIAEALDMSLGAISLSLARSLARLVRAAER
jgi:RNA polymerase sigma-70 factor (ECF subfamily)